MKTTEKEEFIKKCEGMRNKELLMLFTRAISAAATNQSYALGNTDLMFEAKIIEDVILERMSYRPVELPIKLKVKSE